MPEATLTLISAADARTGMTRVFMDHGDVIRHLEITATVQRGNRVWLSYKDGSMHVLNVQNQIAVQAEGYEF